MLAGPDHVLFAGEQLGLAVVEDQTIDSLLPHLEPGDIIATGTPEGVGGVGGSSSQIPGSGSIQTPFENQPGTLGASQCPKSGYPLLSHVVQLQSSAATTMAMNSSVQEIEELDPLHSSVYPTITASEVVKLRAS